MSMDCLRVTGINAVWLADNYSVKNLIGSGMIVIGIMIWTKTSNNSFQPKRDPGWCNFKPINEHRYIYFVSIPWFLRVKQDLTWNMDQTIQVRHYEYHLIYLYLLFLIETSSCRYVSNTVSPVHLCNHDFSFGKETRSKESF